MAIEKEKIGSLEKAIDLVLSPMKNDNYLPYHLLQKKRQRKKRSLHL